MSEPWVSMDDVVKRLGVATDSVYRWSETGRLPAHIIGRHWKVRLTEIDAWVHARTEVEAWVHADGSLDPKTPDGLGRPTMTIGSWWARFGDPPHCIAKGARQGRGLR